MVTCCDGLCVCSQATIISIVGKTFFSLHMNMIAVLDVGLSLRLFVLEFDKNKTQAHWMTHETIFSPAVFAACNSADQDRSTRAGLDTRARAHTRRRTRSITEFFLCDRLKKSTSSFHWAPLSLPNLSLSEHQHGKGLFRCLFVQRYLRASSVDSPAQAGGGRTPRPADSTTATRERT